MTLIELEDARYKAMLLADRFALAKQLHPKLIYTHSTGVIDTKDQLIGKIISAELVYARIDYRVNSEYRDESHWLINSDIEMAVTVGGVKRDVRSRALSVWLATDGAWQLAAFHATPRS